MGKFTLGFNNQADLAVLSGGSWRVDHPLTRLKDYRVPVKARTVDANPVNTQLFFQLPEKIHIGVVGLMGTNASADCQVRVVLFDSAAFTTLIYDSGLLPVYPTGTMPYGSIPWGAPNWWTGKPTPAEISRFQNNVPHVLSNATFGQYGAVQINDPANANGYFEAGRLLVGSVFQPQLNPQAGKASLRLTSRSTVTRAKDGTPYKQAERPDLSLPFALEMLTLDEAMRGIDLQAIVDIYGEVMAMEDPTDMRYAFRRQVFGRLRDLDPIEHSFMARFSTAFQVEGSL